MGLVRANDDSCNNALCGPGGVQAVIAEPLLLKQPLIVVRPYAVLRRTRRREGAERGAAVSATWGRRRAGAAGCAR